MALAFASGLGQACAADPHLGVIEYEISCLPCHGIDGRGDGPVGKSLKSKPADLTQISRRNRGQFPYQSVINIIDGRTLAGSHTDRDMPVWGDRYRSTAPSQPDKWDRRVRAQIAALAKYIETLQEK